MSPAPGMSSRIPSLDGARALSALLVLASHMRIFSGVPVLEHLDDSEFFSYGRYLDYGNLGVRIFFVISGFLITSLLIKEHERTGGIQLGRFYLRRALRILPPYWAYIAAIALLMVLGKQGLATWSEVPAAFAYFSNYFVPRAALTHTWSLSVEEQFYLLWPPLIVLAGMKKAPRACLVVLVAAPLFRVLTDAGLWLTPLKFAFESTADALASGCLLALLRGRLWQLTPYRWLVSSPLAWLLPLIALPLMSTLLPSLVRDVVAIPLLNIGIAVLLDRYMREPGTLVGRLLNVGPMVWLGTLSYSLYLWQQIFAFGSSPWPIRMALLMGFAMASYYLLERPLLGLRERLRAAPARVPAPSSPDAIQG